MVACLAIGVARIVSTYHGVQPDVGRAGARGGRHAVAGPRPATPTSRCIRRWPGSWWRLAPGSPASGRPGTTNVWLEGNSILYAGGRYDRNLALARLGVLPFFLLATLVVLRVGLALGGAPAAVCAVLLFTTLPPVLAHAGIATTDMAVTATIALAALLPDTAGWSSPRRGAQPRLGLALGLALLSKLSALLFLPAACLAVALCRRGQHTGRRARPWTGPHDQAPADVRCRAAHRVGRLSVRRRPSDGPEAGPRARRSSRRSPASTAWPRAVFPAPALFEGLGQLAAKNRAGHKSYLLGEVRTTGWWYFFPVALAVKTPLPFLLLIAAGSRRLLARLPGVRSAAAARAGSHRACHPPGLPAEPDQHRPAPRAAHVPVPRHRRRHWGWSALWRARRDRPAARALASSCWSAGRSSPRPGRIRTISPTSTSWRETIRSGFSSTAIWTTARTSSA